MFGKKGNQQGSARQTNACQRDTCPSGMVPAGAGKESPESASYKVSRHENRVHTVGGVRCQRQGAGLIAYLDALHADVYQENAGYDTCVSVLEEIQDAPGENHDAASDEVEAAHAVPMHVFPYERGGQSSSYAT